MGNHHHECLENMYHRSPVSSLYEPKLRVGDGEAEITMPVNPLFFHAAGALHGSVLFKALDDAAFFAVNSLVDDVFVLTVTFNIYLLRPVTGGELRAAGRVTSASRKLFTAESSLFVNGDKQVARGSGSFMRSAIRLDSVDGYQGEP